MRKLLIISLLVFITGAASAQSFFKPLPKPAISGSIKNGLEQPSVENVFRPIANVASYGIPGNILLTGGGVSYQHLVYDYNTQKWNAIWSINALGWLTTTPDPSQPTPNAISYGLAAGFLNNLVMVGAAVNGNRIIATVGIGISLNN